VVRLLPHNALRVDEACSAGLADLPEDRGHRVLTVLGKGNRKREDPADPGTCGVLDAYLADRAVRAGLAWWQCLFGPMLATPPERRATRWQGQAVGRNRLRGKRPGASQASQD
jgi:integrase